MPRTFHTFTRSRWHLLLIAPLLILMLMLAACGGGGSMSSGTGSSASIPSSSMNQPALYGNHSSQASGSSSQASQKSASTNSSSSSPAIITQYLVKTLKVTMQVKDTMQVADDLQNWISQTDSRSTSAGMDYEQAGTNQYNISLSFSVTASNYPQVERYLRDYAPQHKGQLLGFTESVQDVTNDYIDTQSRLTNLRAEQARLLDLQSKAQTLGDIITVQNKLTDVEGQIESIESHIKALNNQVTYYTINIVLQPIAVATPPSPPTATGWNLGQVLHDAFASSLAFALALLSFFIWVFAYGVYLVPIGLIALGVWQWRKRLQRIAPVPKAGDTTANKYVVGKH